MKLNKLIHLKTVLVKDHIEYKKETRKSNHSNLIKQSLSDICYGTWETVRNFLCNTRKIGKNGNKKVKLNGLIHSKTELVKDHV